MDEELDDEEEEMSASTGASWTTEDEREIFEMEELVEGKNSADEDALSDCDSSDSDEHIIN